MSVDISGSIYVQQPQPTATFQIPVGMQSLLGRIPQAWLGMSGYLLAGVALGLLLIVGISVMRSSDPQPTANGVVTDNIVRLDESKLAGNCWSGVATDSPARLTVSMEVGLDGKVRYAAASGGSPAMRQCVESHVKSWEFLPQATAQAMVLPFEVDHR